MTRTPSAHPRLPSSHKTLVPHLQLPLSPLSLNYCRESDVSLTAASCYLDDCLKYTWPYTKLARQYERTRNEYPRQYVRKTLAVIQLALIVILVVSLSACTAPMKSGANPFATTPDSEQGLLSDGAAPDSSTGLPNFGHLNNSSTYGAELDANIQKYIDGLPQGTIASVGYQKLDGSNTQHIVGSTGEMKTASVIKLWVAAMALQKGTATNYQLEQMISYSHNLTTNDLANSIGGLVALNNAINTAGYPNTRMECEMGGNNAINVEFNRQVAELVYDSMLS